MSAPILATKLYAPPPRPRVVLRPRLIERLNEGLHRKLALISAAAGFGKTTLVSEWVAACPQPAAWLSLDAGDSDPTRFLTYLVATLQTVVPKIGAGLLDVLQSPQPPPVESILTVLINEISTVPHDFVLVLDDYHVVDAPSVDQALTFLLEHLPPQMHLVITTREDPALPLARLRAGGQLTELRVTDLRFTLAEAAGFLNQAMGLKLSAENVAALETRTEGWIAGLQLAAISLQGQQDAARFIQTFTGGHQYVLDYLVAEVLQQQPANIQTFLLRTSILERLCGPLCDAVLLDSSASSQVILESIERANLFIVPLDNERRWYRYHHLFADLLRRRLQQPSATATLDAGQGIAELHMRASRWYEANGLDIEAFHHAVAANEIDHAARLVEGGGMPLPFRGAAIPVLNWLKSLPTSELDARPAMWVIYASVLLFANQVGGGVEEKLQAAEAALEGATQGAIQDDRTRDLIGHIASIRATVAVVQHQADTILVQSHRALEYLHPLNLPVRTATTWTLGHAYELQGDRAAATRAYTEALATSQAIGHFIITLMATNGLGRLQEADNQLELAAATYRRVLELAGDPPSPVACEAHLGLARIFYARNALDRARPHAELALQLARQVENADRFVACEVFLARLKLAAGDPSGASAILAAAEQHAQQHNFVLQVPEVAAAQVLVLLRQGQLAAAAHLVQRHTLPLSQARMHLALGDAAAALALLEPLRRQAEAKGWANERLKVMVVQVCALQAHGAPAAALSLLEDALALAAPEGFIRLFVDEGPPMAQLLAEAAARGVMPGYASMLLAAFDAEGPENEDRSILPSAVAAQPLVEPLSQRELEILQLIAQGRSNREIGEELFLALDTVKGHNRRIFDKLQVQRRTEAVAKARSLNLLPRGG